MMKYTFRKSERFVFRMNDLERLILEISYWAVFFKTGKSKNSYLGPYTAQPVLK